LFDDITFLVRYGPQIRINFGGRTYIVETPIIPTPDVLSWGIMCFIFTADKFSSDN